jgi:hypothetical protein
MDLSPVAVFKIHEHLRPKVRAFTINSLVEEHSSMDIYVQ